VIRPGARLRAAALLPALALSPLAAPPLASAARAPAAPAPPRGPRLVLVSSSAGERTVTVRDLKFVVFRRTYYQRRAPRAEDASGRRVDVEDRRLECRCVRFADWSKVKLKFLRQVEITYPEGGREALVRLTGRDGKVREFPAGSLFGAAGSLPPRFAATVDGTLQEFPLLLGDQPGEEWPEERLVRILLVPPLPAPAPRRR